MVTSTPSQSEFLERLGFTTNPFQFTNADEEAKLPEYFVPPPYFASVYGDPAQPSSCIVFAPRGAGKSAQRKMVESSAPHDTVLCITYDSFRNPRGAALTDMTIEDHQLNLARRVLVGILTWLQQHKDRAGRLTPEEKSALRALATARLTSATRAELQVALDSLRNLPVRAKEFWNDNHWVLDAVLSSVNIAAGGPGSGRLPDAPVDEVVADALMVDFDSLAKIASKIGISAVYILIDRIDETAETNVQAEAAYKLIRGLIHDLKVLEQRPFAYKFFVPDYIGPFYQRDGGRSDRIRAYETQWKNDELISMLNRRLKAHSAGRVDSITDLLPTTYPAGAKANLRHMALLFANHSPRDLIRIWGRVVDEQLRRDPTASALDREAILDGIDVFCFERADELATPGVVRALTRVGRVDFTVTEVASNVLHVVNNAARARIQFWEQRGVIKQIGEIPSGRGRPHHHYGIIDVRVARAAHPNVSLQQFVDAKARLCPVCESWVLRDWNETEGAGREDVCVECGVLLATVPPVDAPPDPAGSE